MKIINNIYDLISLLILYLIFYSIFSKDYIMLIGIITSNIIHKIIKYFTTPFDNEIFKRPKKNFNNDLFNQGGHSNRSGFPSGHMTTMSFFMNTLLFRNHNYSPLNIILFNFPSLLMGLARYCRNSHNLIQIFAGYLLGFGCAYYFFEKSNFILEMMNNIV
jgi:membrane-associated phospholipid phosphatase